VDKSLGGIMMAIGGFLLFKGFQMAMYIYNNPLQLAPPSMGGGSMEELVSSAITSMFAPYISGGMRIGAAALIIWIGSILLGKGIQLFKR